MADPVSALATVGTVSSLMQVISFSVNILDQASKLLREDNRARVVSLAQLGKRHAEVHGAIKQRANNQRPLASHEAATDRLAEQCCEVSGELVEMLDDPRGVLREIPHAWSLQC